MQEQTIQTGRRLDHTNIIDLPLTVHEAAWLRDALALAADHETREGQAAWLRSFARGLQGKINNAREGR